MKLPWQKLQEGIEMLYQRAFRSQEEGVKRG